MSKCAPGEIYIENVGAGRCVPNDCPPGRLPTLTTDAETGTLTTTCSTPCAADQIYIRYKANDLCLTPDPCEKGKKMWLAIGEEEVQGQCIASNVDLEKLNLTNTPSSSSYTGFIVALVVLLVLLILIVSLYAMSWGSKARWDAESPFRV